MSWSSHLPERISWRRAPGARRRTDHDSSTLGRGVPRRRPDARVRRALPHGADADQARAATRLSRRPHRLQLPRRHLDRERDRRQSRSPHRPSRPRHVSALLARRQVDRVLVQPLRQQRRLRRPRRRRRAPAADVPRRRRRRRRLDARLDERADPRSARRRRVPQCRDAVGGAGRRRTRAAAAGRLGLLRQLLARRQVARVQPPSSDAGRASTIAAATPRICGSPTSPPRPTRSCCPTSATTATGRCGAPTTRSTSSPIRCRTISAIVPGSPEVRKSANNIYKIPASGSGQPVQVTHHPTATCSGRRCRATAR